MSELAAAGIPVAVTCPVLKIARQPYYRWLAHPVTPAELELAYRANALFDAHRDDPEFGYRFLADEARDAGVQMDGAWVESAFALPWLWWLVDCTNERAGLVGRGAVRDDLQRDCWGASFVR